MGELDSQARNPFTETNQRQDGMNSSTYQAYLLRLWRSRVDGNWRASLQTVQTGERHMFADLESLLAFLVEQVRSPPAV